MAMASRDKSSSAKMFNDKIVTKENKKSQCIGTSRKKKQRRKNNVGNNRSKGWQEEQEEYYQRLLYASKKDLRKQAKIVRTFECQKMIRKIKEKKQDDESHHDTDKSVAVVEDSLEQMKKANLEAVVQESLRRLGIIRLDPRKDPNRGERSCYGNPGDDEENGIESMDQAAKEDSETKSVEGIEDHKGPSNHQSRKIEISDSSVIQSSLVEKILKHKKMQTALENWNEQVTEYRRWILKQQDKTHGIASFAASTVNGGDKKKKKRRNSIPGSPSVATYPPAPNKSLFVCLGREGEMDNTDEMNFHEAMPQYGPGQLEEKKKNRPGQRARKAKVMAIEAKKAGRSNRAAESFNWRPKKQEQKSSDEGKSAGPAHSSAEANEPQQSLPDKELHPSWAAKKEEKAGIVEFKGTKITFS